MPIKFHGHVTWFESYLNFLTSRIWIPNYLRCLNLKLGNDLLTKLEWHRNIYIKGIFMLQLLWQVEYEGLQILNEQVLYSHIHTCTYAYIYKDALLFWINICYEVLTECLLSFFPIFILFITPSCHLRRNSINKQFLTRPLK